MNKIIKISLGLSISFIVLLLFTVLISYVILIKPLPDYAGELEFEGITAEVDVYRDSFAIPYIFAKTEEDAAFTLGYAHAQERLFQMDLVRRAGEGRLSEIFGSKTIPFDKMFRTLGLFNYAEKVFHDLSPISKKMLIAYSKGVNAFIREANGNYSIEFDVLGYDPYLWKPAHSIVISKVLAWVLNISWWTDIAFVHLIQKLGEKKVREIIPDYPENAPTVIPPNINSYAEITTDFIETDKKFRDFIGFIGTHIGSNNWVLNGKLSASGKPIIANDPHIALTLPGIWYVAVIRSDEWNAEGFTLPGVPGFVIGKNKNISWVFTNLMADDCDFYVEKLDSFKTKYFLNDEWNNLNIHKDTIHVKDSLDYIFEVKHSHRGPIISDIHLYNKLYPDTVQNKAVVSMRWTALDFSDELYSILSMNKASNWEEFKEAVRHYSNPGQNFVYGDIEGNIGYICAAKLPIRNNVSPTFVYDGTTDQYDWKGYVPYEKMPKLLNPAQNFIASANNKTVEDFEYHISNIWEPPSRIERIVELLNIKSTHSAEDFKKYQMDQVSHYAEKIVQHILSAFAGINIKDDNLKQALELIKRWDYDMNKFSQVPTIYSLFYYKLIQNVFDDEMGENLLNEFAFISNIPHRSLLTILDQNKSSWFDDINTDFIEDRDDMIRKSMVDALDELEKKFGKEIVYWQWGEMHRLTFKHFFNGYSPLVDMLVNVGPFSMGGDGTTIFNSEYSFKNPFENVLGPTMRFIYDFSEPDQFEFILTAGQSGHIMSEHYKDMTEMWLKGDYINIKVNEENIRDSDFDLLKLIPN